MRTVNAMKSLWLLGLLGGCSLFQDHMYKDYGVDALTLDQKSAAVQLQVALAAPGAETGKPLVDSNCFNVPVAQNLATTCQQQRNAAIANLLNASDDLCQAHLKTIFGNDASFNIATGTIAVLSSGWATITSGTSAKSAMSAVSTFANAERSLVNETVYKNMIVTAVTRKIRDARNEKAAAMIPGSFSKGIDEYPMHLAMHDVITYHYTCSFMFGLERALEEGMQPGLDTKKAKLEQEKQNLEQYIDNRRAILTGKMTNPDENDPGIKGAKARVAAIEEQLLNLVRASTLASTSGSEKTGSGGSGMAAPPSASGPTAPGK